MNRLTGRVKGTTITLDERVPELEGRRVLVIVEPADDLDIAIDTAGLWREWVERGPQGPLEDEGEPEFP